MDRYDRPTGHGRELLGVGLESVELVGNEPLEVPDQQALVAAQRLHGLTRGKAQVALQDSAVKAAQRALDPIVVFAAEGLN